MSALWNKAKSWSPLGAILRWIQDPNRNDLSHLQLCGEREIERIARDSGLSVSEFRALQTLGPNTPDLLERRMAALDLDPVEVSAIAPTLSAICNGCARFVKAMGDACETLDAILLMTAGKIIAPISGR
jgi:hypothetical protein